MNQERLLPRASLGLLGAILLFSVAGGSVYGVSAYAVSPHEVLLPPSLHHPFGTDLLGRDVLARTMEGGKISLLIGFASALAATLAGTAVGIAAAFFRGAVDRASVIAIDVFLTFPTFFLLLALVSMVQASAWVLILVLAVTGWMGTARMVRSDAFAVGNKPFIKILRQGGVSRIKILAKYYTPLLVPLIAVSFAFAASGAILSESALSFLGLGVMPPDVSWGVILAEGKDLLEEGWWISFFPGLLIFFVTLSLINLADYFQQLANERQTFGS